MASLFLTGDTLLCILKLKLELIRGESDFCFSGVLEKRSDDSQVALVDDRINNSLLLLFISIFHSNLDAL
jgi:hypothetical protein